MRAKDYRTQARDALRGKWIKTVLILLLAGLMGAVVGNSAVSSFSVDLEMFNFSADLSGEETFILGLVSSLVLLAGLVSLFLGSYVRVGLAAMGVNMLDGEKPRVGMLFPKNLYGKALGMHLLRGLFITLGMILLIVPGVILCYSFAMAEYLLVKNPEMGVAESLRESRRRMQGRKLRLFCLELSFFGWAMLCTAPVYLWTFGVAVYGEFFGNAFSLVPVFLSLIPCALVSAVGYMFLNAYMHISFMAFFCDADRAAEWRSEAQQGEEYAEATWGAAPDAGDAYHADAQSEPVTAADETAARAMFMQHKCSRDLLCKAEMLEEYMKLNPSAIAEARWKREYGDDLMRRFDRDPSALDDLLALASEYSMDDYVNRALQRIERHLRQETLQDAEIVNMCGRVLALLLSGCFSENPGFISRKQEQISDMIDRLEQRLSEADPGGDWQESVNLIRKMCM